jgi:hypothetical protein
MPSTKRVAFFFALFTLIFIAIVNLFTGKTIAQVILEDIFFVVQSLLLSIVGVSVASKITDVKKVQSANNALVGAPSPQPVAEGQASVASGAPAAASAVVTEPK